MSNGQHHSNSSSVKHYVCVNAIDGKALLFFRDGSDELRFEKFKFNPAFCHVYARDGVKEDPRVNLVEEAVRILPYVPTYADRGYGFNEENLVYKIHASSHRDLLSYVRDPQNRGKVFFDLMNPLYRFCLENNVEFLARLIPKILVFDIECLHQPGKLPNPKREEDKVVFISVAYGVLGSTPQIKTLCLSDFQSEQDMVNAFESLVDEVDPDIVASYTPFDVEYLVDRFGSLGIGFKRASPRIRRNAFLGRIRRRRYTTIEILGRNYVDFYVLVRGHPDFRKMESANLKDASAFFNLGVRRDPPLRADEINRYWENDRERLRRYVEDDAHEAFLIGNILLPQEVVLSRLLMLPLYVVTTLSQYALIHRYVAIQADKRNVAMPIRPREKHERYEGAISKAYHRGFFKNVAKFDVASLYPSIMLEYKIKPNLGLLGEIYLESLKDLTRERLNLKAKLKTINVNGFDYQRVNAQQLALKILINAMYGQLGYGLGIFYDRERAAEVTKHGRDILLKIQGLAEDKGLTVLEVDTDGLYIHFSDQDLKAFTDKVNSQLPPLIKLKFEGSWSTGVFHAAKNYVLFDDSRDKLTIVGSAFKTKKYCKLARETVTRAMKEFFRSSGDVKAFRNIVLNVKERLLSGDYVPEEICRRAKLSEPPDKYVNEKAEHVIAAKRLINAGLNVGEGYEVEYFFARGGGLKSLRATPIQMFDYEKVDVTEVLNEIYSASSTFISAACCLSKRKEALTILTHGEMISDPVTNSLSAPKREIPPIETPIKPSREAEKIFETRVKEPHPREETLGVIVQLPLEGRGIFNYGYPFKPDYKNFPHPPEGLDHYLVYTEMWINGHHIYLHLVDVDEPVSDRDYSQIVSKLRPLKIISYKTTTFEDDRFRCHILIPIKFDGSKEGKYAVKRRMFRKIRKELGIPDCRGNVSTWCRLPLTSYDLKNHSTKDSMEEIRFIQNMDVDGIIRAALFNRKLIEPSVESTTILPQPKVHKDIYPCIERIIQDPRAVGQSIADIEGIRHKCFISTVWFLARYPKVNKKEAREILLKFAEGMRYDETPTHASSAERQIEYGFEYPFAIDCEALEIAGLCDKGCHKRRWRDEK